MGWNIPALCLHPCPRQAGHKHFVAERMCGYNASYVTVRALVIVARHPNAMIARAEIDTYWASLRSAAFPSEMLNAVWLVDPRRCIW